MKGKCREEEEGASFEGGGDAAVRLKAMGAMGAKGVNQAVEFRNVEAVPTFDNIAVQTIHGGSKIFYFQFGIIAESGIPVGYLSVGGERGIVVNHNCGGASVSAAFYIGVFEEHNLGAHGSEGHLSRRVEFRGEEMSRITYVG